MDRPIIRWDILHHCVTTGSILGVVILNLIPQLMWENCQTKWDIRDERLAPNGIYRWEKNDFAIMWEEPSSANCNDLFQLSLTRKQGSGFDDWHRWVCNLLGLHFLFLFRSAVTLAKQLHCRAVLHLHIVHYSGWRCAPSWFAIRQYTRRQILWHHWSMIAAVLWLGYGAETPPWP